MLIDSLYQFKFGENIFGFKITDTSSFRIKILFGKDEILGSYSIRLLPVTLFLIIFFFNKSIIKKKIFVTISIIIVSILVLLSGERTSLVLFLLLIFFLFSSSFKLRKLLIIPSIIALITLTIVILKSETIKNRMIYTTINQLGLNEKSERLVLYEGHYLIALNMFKKNV